MPDARTPKDDKNDGVHAQKGEDWRLTLPAEWTAPGRDSTGAEAQIPLREHPALAKYASKDEAIKALVHAQRLLGRKGEADSASLLAGEAPRPGALVPPSPDAYRLPELELPEEFVMNEALRLAYLEKAHELGLSEEQAAGLYAWFLPLNVQAAQDHEKGRKEERVRRREGELAALRQVHGGAAAGVLDAARRAVLALGGKELMERLERCGAADDAGVVQAFARVAPLVSESGMRGRAGAPAQGVTPQALRQMLRDPRYHDPSRRDQDFVRQVREGFEALYPGEKTPEARA